MAERLKVSESWLTRYLDLARLPEELTRAFADPQELGIRNAIALKALLKPELNARSEPSARLRAWLKSGGNRTTRCQ
jgi:ParB family chromosome partitioning protein